ncbi:MAG TPA: hypothetical protein VMM14_04230 [Acidimicrobiia bacterium]|nr:hypothetical protein [Acidimicrobiia bacterium]
MDKKPFAGTILGILIGASIAVILAREGIWPADQLTLFLLPALTGLIGMMLLSFGREGPYVTTIVSLMLLVPMLVWGALGVAKVDQRGQLNGGCTVSATSGADMTTVTDTSRADPFPIHADGGLAWTASSPGVFTGYDWSVDAVLGGIPVPVASDTEANENGDIENGAEVSDIGAYAASRDIDLDLYQGVYEVSGSAATCNGFGFVRVIAEGLDLVTIIAAVVLAASLLGMVALFNSGRADRRSSAALAAQSKGIDVGEKLRGYQAGSDGGLHRDDFEE